MTEPKPDLTRDEREMAAKTGMPEARYAAVKGVRNLDDWWKTRGLPGAPDGPQYNGPRQVDDPPGVDDEG